MCTEVGVEGCQAYGYEQLAYAVYKMDVEGVGVVEEWKERAGQVAKGLVGAYPLYP